MTKRQAIQKLAVTMSGKPIQLGDIPFGQFVAYCEAIGLIKFDPETDAERNERLCDHH